MPATGPQDTDRHNRRRYWRWLALLPLLVYASYLAGANWLLNTSWAQKELADRTNGARHSRFSATRHPEPVTSQENPPFGAYCAAARAAILTPLYLSGLPRGRSPP